jgi:hypothetical protein
MKTTWIVFCLGLWLGSYYPAPANPIIAPFFNELAFTPNGWVLEIRHYEGMNMDGWCLISRLDTAYFKSSVTLTEYCLITQDSLLSPLRIDPTGDSISICQLPGILETFVFGTFSEAVCMAPKTGQSICREWSADAYFYLDNTPTLGQQNDTINATGTVAGLVKDSEGLPLSDVFVWYSTFPAGLDPNEYVLTDTAGYFNFSFTARKQMLIFEKNLYVLQDTILQMWPDSTVTMNITLVKGSIVEKIESQTFPKEFSIGEPYPNPFNPEMQMKYTIPNASNVTIDVFDINGKLVDKIFSGYQSSGSYQAHWNATRFSSGVYIIRILAGDVMMSKKCVLVK